jgi:predicted DNA-binding transcriptional regulator AlpA
MSDNNGNKQATPELLTLQQVAGILSCSVRQVQRLVKMGKLPPPIRILGLVRFPGREIQTWLDLGCKPVRTSEGGVI